jgi:hypothetical protein
MRHWEFTDSFVGYNKAYIQQTRGSSNIEYKEHIKTDGEYNGCNCSQEKGQLMNMKENLYINIQGVTERCGKL